MTLSTMTSTNRWLSFSLLILLRESRGKTPKSQGILSKRINCSFLFHLEIASIYSWESSKHTPLSNCIASRSMLLIAAYLFKPNPNLNLLQLNRWYQPLHNKRSLTTVSIKFFKFWVPSGKTKRSSQLWPCRAMAQFNWWEVRLRNSTCSVSMK